MSTTDAREVLGLPADLVEKFGTITLNQHIKVGVDGILVPIQLTNASRWQTTRALVSAAVLVPLFSAGAGLIDPGAAVGLASALIMGTAAIYAGFIRRAAADRTVTWKLTKTHIDTGLDRLAWSDIAHVVSDGAGILITTKNGLSIRLAAQLPYPLGDIVMALARHFVAHHTPIGTAEDIPETLSQVKQQARKQQQAQKVL
jgi:hypothetical protein